jgi:antibiotic biosynthesis monooxygenase
MLAVTTRNRLRSARFCVPMLLARREIAQQLAHQSGLLRYASGITSPTEFFTLTVWRDREAMQRFMQSGAHERHMWHFTRWSSSFWGMRWEPLTETTPRPISPLIAAGLLTPHATLAGPLGPRPEGVDVEPRGAGVTCVTAIFEGAVATVRARAAASRLRALQRSDPRLLRWGVGLDVPPRGLAITLWEGLPRSCVEILGGATWVGTWQAADYEIGHWDGLRLRQVARRRVRDRVDIGH